MNSRGRPSPQRAGDVDLFEIAPATDRPVSILGLVLGQSSELQEAEEEQLRLKVIRGHVTGGNGTATTPTPIDDTNPTAGFTAEVLGTTVATGGSPIDVHSDVWQVRAGYQLFLPPKMEWKLSAAANRLVVRLMAAVADDLTASGTLYIEEH